MQVDTFRINKPTNYELHCTLYSKNNSNLVIFCHGGLGDRFEHGRFPFAAEIFLAEGFDVLLFDFSGFGENNRIPISLSLLQTDLKDVWEWAKSQSYNNIATLGLSLGGLISLLSPLPNRFCAVFWSPAFDLMNSISPLQKILGKIKFAISSKPMKMNHTGAGPKLLFGKKFMDEVLTLNIGKNLREFTLPTLIIQGTKDTTVNPESIKNAFAMMPDDSHHELKLIEGASHDFEGTYLESYITNTLIFLKNHLSDENQ
ncbi:MAG: alpha/beta fold hydrolase [Candidatus Lokiarchaeota archaeon]|nr:alpha/beta fold hydrolase [Candidatus Lokiarchaeota archaeon]